MTTVDQPPPRQQDSRRSAWRPPHYVLSLSLAIPAILLGLEISGWVFAVRALQQGRVDFRSQYTAGYMVRTGNAHLLYNYNSQLFFQNHLVSARDLTMPFDHLAYESLVYVPFSYLPFKTAYLGFLAFNLVALALIINVLRRWTPSLDSLYPWQAAVMVLVFLPTAVALMQGQDSILILLCLTAAFSAIESNRDFRAGFVLGLGMFKFQIVLPVALLFLVWKKWRFVCGFFVSAIALVAGSIVLIGRQAASAYFTLLVSMSIGLHSAADQARLGVPPTAMPNLRGVLTGLLGSAIPGRWIHITIVALSLIVLIAAYTAGRVSTKGASLLIAILAAALVSYHSLIHDMTILLLPTLLFLSQCLPAVPDGEHRQRNMAVLAAALFTAPILFCFMPERFYLAGLATCALFVSALSSTRSTTGPKTLKLHIGPT